MYESLKKDFSGEIILPKDARYEHARMAFIIKGSPAVVLQPRSTADTAAAIRFARKHFSVISIKSGGHNGAALATNTDGIVIDVSLINTVEVLDKEKRLVRIGAGAVWGNVAAALHEHSLAVSSGDTISVGVGGLVLGGGIGWMVRKYGLAIDHLKAADIVTAEGKILRTSATEHSDLFWGIRGGGGNFGIVTHFEFTAQPVNQVFAGMIVYTAEKLQGLITGWRDVMRKATEDLTTTLVILPPMMGNPAMAIAFCCYAGSDDQSAATVFEPLLHIGTVVQNTVTKKQYKDVLEQAHPPEGVKILVHNGFAPSLSDALIEAIASVSGKTGSPAMQIRSIGGAMNRVPSDATAFAHRNSEVLLIAATFVPLGASGQEQKQALVPWNTVAPFTSGAYVNFFTDATGKETSASYPTPVMHRLAMIKKKYDPENVFNRNYNIAPAK